MHKRPPLPFANHTDSAMKNSGTAGATNATPPLTSIAYRERLMAMIPLTARDASAQDAFTDPLILQARFVNEAAALDRALAMRKALRPQRSQAARKGWEVRRG